MHAEASLSRYDEPLLRVAFNFNMRPYSWEALADDDDEEGLGASLSTLALAGGAAAGGGCRLVRALRDMAGGMLRPSTRLTLNLLCFLLLLLATAHLYEHLSLRSDEGQSRSDLGSSASSHRPSCMGLLPGDWPKPGDVIHDNCTCKAGRCRLTQI